MQSKAEDWRDWIQRCEFSHDTVTPGRIDALAATLDYPDPPARDGDPVPAGWHRLFFHDVVRISQLRGDGHIGSGELMPPVPLPRRMWASTRLQFIKPILVGEPIRRMSVIAAIDEKVGTTGRLVFVTTKMEYFAGPALAVVEEQTSVFRGREKPKDQRKSASLPPASAQWLRTIEPSPVLLFRYSALTMNSHRIHYDRRHAVEVEGYPGLLVHGSLQTLLMLDLVRQENPARQISQCTVRAMAPIFDDGAFQVGGALRGDGQGATAWTLTANGGLAASATMTFGV